MSGLSLGVPRSRRAAAPGSDGVAGSSSAPSSSTFASDQAVRATDSDALLSRLSAMRAGYLPSESFSAHFVPMGTPQPLPRRPPIINIGTALRCRRLDECVERFLSEGEGKKQIVSLGAGSDARFWRIQAEEKLDVRLARYVELDFPQLTRAKIERIARSEPLRKRVGGTGPQGMRVEQNGSALHTSRLHILPCDLRQIATAPPSSLDEGSAPHISESLLSVLDASLPTLLLAECVLAYLPSASSQALLQWFAQRFGKLEVLAYDMCIGGDAGATAAGTAPSRFGQVMLSNLGARGLDLPGARGLTTPEAYAGLFERTLSACAEGDSTQSEAQSLKHVWSALPAEERVRLSRLEGLDEVEELEMLLSHYCVSWAKRSGTPAAQEALEERAAE